MLKNKVAEKYAQALFELAVEEETLDKTQQEFSEVIRMVNEVEELKQVLEHPKLAVKQKRELFDNVFSDEISEMLLNFIKLLFDKRREIYLEDVYQQFEGLISAQRNKIEVAVKAPIELSEKNKNSLKGKLEKFTGKEVDLDIEIQPDLLGGLIVKIGDKVIDGSLSNQLNKMKKNLNNLEVSKLGVR
ncbi:ATP synthase F1 subunit delta [Natroniella sulfidigena]|uniref:ATP synthase F1 subunit delta n=1 Tax=Natroniella sulfidigena TaxID=723921 RepID=UPI00200AF885|nr:ATP synthase F1 subunit delta [Natroniella sulfidigena]MCK8816394.1 ATP synthase F1 subunit delta [Natroniella sulfidigena]